MANERFQNIEPAATPGSLRDALSTLFEQPRRADGRFSERLCEFVRNLTNARGVGLFSGSKAEPLTSIGILDPVERLIAVAKAATDTDRVVSDGATALAVALSLPDGNAAVLALHMPPGNPVQFSLAHERLELIHRVCASNQGSLGSNLPPGILETAAAVGKGEWSQAQALSDSLSAASGGVPVSIAEMGGGRVKRCAISGQVEPSRRGNAMSELQDKIDAAMVGDARGMGVYLDGDAAPRYAIVPKARPPSEAALLAAVEVLTGCNRQYQSWTSRNRRVLVRTAIAAGLAALLLWPVDDAVDLPASVVAETARIVTAPFDGQIAEIAVEDGSRVAAGETLLIRMDKTQIDLELAESRAALAAALTRKDSLRARNDAAALREAEIEAEQARLTVDALEQKRGLAEVYAPIDGVVQAEELSQRLGSFVGLGMPVLSIQGEAGVALEVVIDPRARGRMREGNVGEFRPDSAPSRVYLVSLSVISPAPVFEGQAVTYLGRTKLNAPDDGEFLKSGMQGVAHFVFDEVALGLLIWRRLRDWALITFWI
ncbi:MAG: HlyD family efflux transporter periplasmic adaptor subunit [Paracoccaceae bacterium]|nr:HlyD family efflux transporter periplasmic adaptor subunit [Paracoccaceae bacterium]